MKTLETILVRVKPLDSFENFLQKFLDHSNKESGKIDLFFNEVIIFGFPKLSFLFYE